MTWLAAVTLVDEEAVGGCDAFILNIRVKLA